MFRFVHPNHSIHISSSHTEIGSIEWVDAIEYDELNKTSRMWDTHSRRVHHEDKTKGWINSKSHASCVFAAIRVYRGRSKTMKSTQRKEENTSNDRPESKCADERCRVEFQKANRKAITITSLSFHLDRCGARPNEFRYNRMRYINRVILKC